MGVAVFNVGDVVVIAINVGADADIADIEFSPLFGANVSVKTLGESGDSINCWCSKTLNCCCCAGDDINVSLKDDIVSLVVEGGLIVIVVVLGVGGSTQSIGSSLIVYLGRFIGVFRLPLISLLDSTCSVWDPTKHPSIGFVSLSILVDVWPLPVTSSSMSVVTSASKLSASSSNRLASKSSSRSCREGIEQLSSTELLNRN